MPIIVDDHVAALINLNLPAGAVPTEEEQAIIEVLASQAGVALRNARLHADAERRRREAEVLGDVLRQLTTSLDLDTLLQRIVEGARELRAADAAWITRPVGGGGHSFRYMTGTRFAHWTEVRIEPGRGMGGLVLATRQAVRTDDYRNDPRFGKNHVFAIEAEGVVAQIVLPICWGDQLEGLLYVSRRSPQPFTDRDEALLGRLADQAAIALHNVELLAREQTARAAAEAAERRAAFLAEASTTLVTPLAYDAALAALVRLVVPEWADVAAIDVRDGDIIRRLAVAHVDPRKEDMVRAVRGRHGFDAAAPGGVPHVIRTGRTAFVPEVTEGDLQRAAPDETQLAMLRGLGLRSWIIVPVEARGQILGALTVAMADSGRSYQPADCTLFEEVARRAGLAMDNARLYREAQAASRAKDEFLAVLSHELRTPLNSVYGWARMLRTGGLSPEQIEHAAEVIERNVLAQTQLVEDILDVSRIVTGKMRLDVQSIDLAAVVENALEAVRPAAQAKELRVHTLLDPHAAPITGDPARLQQVVWNLLSNAVKFTPRGGRIEIQLRRIGSRVELTVSDTGQGIPPAVLPYIFERFRQGDSSSTRGHQGLGLGLALVRHLVELHGGRVQARSPGEGQGATFVVTLPVTLAAPSAVDPPPSAAGAGTAATRSAIALAGLRVVVVDDDRDALELAAMILGQAGAETRVCARADEALALLDVWRPDVLVADIEMPGEDGHTLVSQIRARDPAWGGTLPAIALTGYGRTADRLQALAAGFTVHLAKPVEPVVEGQRPDRWDVLGATVAIVGMAIIVLGPRATQLDRQP